MIVDKDYVTHVRGVLCGGQYNYSPKEIAGIRKKLGMSLVEFSRLFFSGKSTIIKWESGARKPSGSSLRLLQFVEIMANDRHEDINYRIRKSYRAKYGVSVIG